MTQPVDIEALRQLMERHERANEALSALHKKWPEASDCDEQNRQFRSAGYECDVSKALLSHAAVDALPSLLTELEALRAERGRMAEGHREAVARCIQIIFETRDGFLSPEYATDQPISSVMERFACDRCIDAISSEFAMGSNEQRQLVGRPTHLEEYRATLKEPSQ
ncbi:hypothetical protein [Sphingobium abikonense]|uniref:hypothetical protein n=1 Tax=Sphingobium abikonense TaxID=86193 RepID=UPI003517C6E9